MARREGEGERKARSVERRESRRSRGELVAVLGPLGAALALAELGQAASPRTVVLLTAFAASLVVGGAALARRRRAARAVITIGWCCGLAALAPTALTRPAQVVVLGLATLALFPLAFLDAIGTALPRAVGREHASARGPVLLVAAGWLLWMLRTDEGVGAEHLLAALAAASAVVLMAARGRTRWLTRAAVALGAGGAVALRGDPRVASLVWVLALLATLPAWGPASAAAESAWAGFVSRPGRALVGTFAATAGVAAVVLALPASDASGVGLPFIDAAFTGVSATCVTGLIVVDTPSAFSPFGQAAVLLFIQLGGVGIMGFYAVVFALVGRRLSLHEERTITTVLQVGERSRLWESVRAILGFTLALELAGTLALAPAFFGHGDPWPVALWRALFTAVSAFCNAGFALQTESLVPYATDPVVLHVVAALIVAGGLSPAVALALPDLVRGRRVSTHARLVLATTAGLLGVSFFLFAAFEWRDSLGGLGWADRLHNAWFQSVTLRTAGFNSVEMAETTTATRAIMIAMMFVGGSPGGTAGGVKTTTLAVLALTIVATLRREPDVVAFRRRVSRETVFEAASVVTVGVTMGLLSLLAFDLTQHVDPEVGFFEIVSALGTVGLSLGATNQLDAVGKLVIMTCMFAGRVGPLTLVLAVAGGRVRRSVTYPEAEVQIG